MREQTTGTIVLLGVGIFVLATVPGAVGAAGGLGVIGRRNWGRWIYALGMPPILGIMWVRDWHGSRPEPGH